MIGAPLLEEIVKSLGAADAAEDALKKGARRMVEGLARQEAQFEERKRRMEKDMKRGARLSTHKFTI